MDYTKTSYCSVGDRSPYDLNKLRYYGEYSAHMFGYYVVGWIPPLKGPLQKADVYLYALDSRYCYIIDYFAFLFGFFGF